LLRKRVTNRLWKDKTNLAQQKAMQVFCDNLQKALLAPPLPTPTPLLAMDPGFQAGIKCAVLDANGQLLFGEEALVTVHFLSSSQRTQALTQLTSLLQIVYSAIEKDSPKPVVTVALGNGHGSPEARDLIRQASDDSHIPIDLQLVNEAGASVWSVTESAQREFPHQPPAAIAAVSIGRRYQNPLFELVKIPPRSLGLGMYQHDLSETELDAKLHSTSVLAVAEVGVDGNACSLEILTKIPGLTPKLCERILAQRPLQSRMDLLTKVTGLGPKTFENCAAFIRIDNPQEPLDRTLVHPESYPLARYLLKQCQWNLDEPQSIGKKYLDTTKVVETAATKFNVSSDRVQAVMQHLKTSITNPDPRLGGGDGLSIVGSALANNSTASLGDIGSIDGCSLLPSHLSKSTAALQKACPLRGIVATVRNVVDFGAFLDFGGENDGLLHRSKLGSDRQLSSLLVGQEVGVDVLSVSPNGRVSLALHGLHLDPDPAEKKSGGGTATGKRSFSTSTANQQPAAKKRRIAKSTR
jgi:protein Tex